MDYVAYLLCYPDGTPFYAGMGGTYRPKTKNRNTECMQICAEIGSAVLTIVELYDTRDAAILREQEWIAQYGRRALGGLLTNRTMGGDGALGELTSQKAREVRAISGKNLVRTPEIRQKMRIAKLGKPLTEQHKKRIGEAIRRRPPRSAEINAKISTSLIGREFSDSHRVNISKSCTGRAAPNKGVPHSEETKTKLKAAWVRRKERQDARHTST